MSSPFAYTRSSSARCGAGSFPNSESPPRFVYTPLGRGVQVSKIGWFEVSFGVRNLSFVISVAGKEMQAKKEVKSGVAWKREALAEFAGDVVTFLNAVKASKRLRSKSLRQVSDALAKAYEADTKKMKKQIDRELEELPSEPEDPGEIIEEILAFSNLLGKKLRREPGPGKIAGGGVSREKPFLTEEVAEDEAYK